MAQARRCSQCGTDWPVRSEYVACPFCETDTWLCNNTDVLTHTEAQTLIRKHREQYQAEEDLDRRLDSAFNEWFCRENGIVNPSGPNGRVATRASGAPLDELYP